MPDHKTTYVEYLEIECFRRLEDVKIEFGKNVTIIAGLNGTSKSTILGMLAQPFSFSPRKSKKGRSPSSYSSKYTDNYLALGSEIFSDLGGRRFQYDCNQVFRLSKKFDYGEKYVYMTKLSGSDDASLPDGKLRTTSSTSYVGKPEERLRFVTKPAEKITHEAGYGNYPHPVIFRGLGRLYPLADSESLTYEEDELSDEESEWYQQTYLDVLCLTESIEGSQIMGATKKGQYATVKADHYDGECSSAGQDNLNQILTAIISFRRLKESLGSCYRGGLLLIDELDATLHPHAQDKLLELLCNVSKELKLQVVATSHSLRVFEMAFKSRFRNDIETIFLTVEDDRIVEQPLETYEEVAAQLKSELLDPRKAKPQKVSVVFEDDVAKAMYSEICGKKLSPFVKTTSTASTSAGLMKSMANLSRKGIRELQSVIFVADGDMKREWSQKSKVPTNVIFLPGDSRPETLIYRELFSRSESDSFWKKPNTSYTKRAALTSKGGRTIEKGDDKNWVKNWFQEQKPFWGREGNRAFKAWVKSNPELCLEFCRSFIKLLRTKYKGGKIPPELVRKIYEQYKTT